jgi:recombination protein RecT
MAKSSYDIISSDIYGVQQTFQAACSDRSLNFEAEAGFAIQSLMANDYAMGIATSNRQSVIDAVTNVAAIGISLNPALKQAYLVPRDGRICLDISYMGLMHLAIQSGSIRWGQCFLVHEADAFEIQGVDQPPKHARNPFAKDRGPIVGVYSVVKTAEGDFLTHPMAIDDVYAIRDRSKAWQAFINKKKSCPWVTDEGEMVKKTCIKQAYKYWPRTEKTGRLEHAVHYLNEQTDEGLSKDIPTNAASHKPTDGEMAKLSTEVQQYIRELASEILELWKLNGDAAAFDRIKADELDETQSIALWSLLPSDMRAALKKEGQGRRDAAATLAAK